MTKRKHQILVQKFIGLLLIVVAILSVGAIDGDSTIPMIIFVSGLILIINNKTFKEIIREESKREIEENEDLK